MPHGQELSVPVCWRRELVPGLTCGQPEGKEKQCWLSAIFTEPAGEARSASLEVRARVPLSLV